MTASFLVSPRTGTGSVIGLTIAAAVGVAVAWHLVRRGRFGVWSLLPWTMALLAGLAVLTGMVRGATEIGLPAAVGVGLTAGAALYGATAAFMGVVGRWPPLRRQSERIYELRGGLSMPAAAFLAAVVVAPAEEIVWRGAVQTLLGGWLGALGGALLTWGLYVVVNAAAGSLPVLLSALVGGAAWGGLAWWTGGVAASIGCHVVWTGLMVIRPPVPPGAG